MVDFAKSLSKLPVGWLLLATAVVLAFTWFLLRFSKRLKEYRGQVLVLAGITWIALVFYVLTYSFPVLRGRLASATDAATVPRLWAIALVPFLLLTLIPMLRGTEEKDEPMGRVGLVGIVILLVVVSLVLFDVIGYYLSSALFILALMLLLNERHVVTLIAVPAGWVVFTYLVFARLLYVPLPVGSVFTAIFGI